MCCLNGMVAIAKVDRNGEKLTLILAGALFALA